MRCISPITLKNPAKISAGLYMTVPCGKCGACKANRRAEWSFRLQEEMRASTNAFFITLTYSNENLKYNINSRLETLEKTDLQKFIKRLRYKNCNKWNNKLRYYAVGEYGTTTLRPHYHAIIYNIHPSLIQSISDIWKLGHCQTVPANEATIHYVTKYHVNYDKKKKGREPEFANMSRRPGIGHSYIEKGKGKWNRDHGRVYVMNNGFAQKMPTYYKKKIFNPFALKRLALEGIDKSDLQYIKEIRRLEKLKIKNPSQYLEEKYILASERVKEKAKKQDKI